MVSLRVQNEEALSAQLRAERLAREAEAAANPLPAQPPRQQPHPPGHSPSVDNWSSAEGDTDQAGHHP